MSFTVAIDGPAAAGKGTISKAVAVHFGFAHLDTGLLYRAVGAKVLAGGDPVEAAKTLTTGDMQGDLRTPEVAQAASRVAVLADVRAALVEFQRSFAAQGDGAVLDGRDIGTVICRMRRSNCSSQPAPTCGPSGAISSSAPKGCLIRAMRFWRM